MEWEHITDRWAAMTQRLRGDLVEAPQSPQVSQSEGQAAQPTAAQSAGTLALATTGDEPSPAPDR